MGKPRLIITALLVAILFVSAIVGTIVYYNSKITSLNSQIMDLNSQITNLNKQITNLEAPYLVTSLGIHEINNGTFNIGNGEKIESNALSILGNVTNEGRSTAHHVGLFVVAQNFYGVTVINMTVPLVGVSGTASVPNGSNLPLTESIESLQSVQLT